MSKNSVRLKQASGKTMEDVTKINHEHEADL